MSHNPMALGGHAGHFSREVAYPMVWCTLTGVLDREQQYYACSLLLYKQARASLRQHLMTTSCQDRNMQPQKQHCADCSVFSELDYKLRTSFSFLLYSSIFLDDLFLNALNLPFP
jgi:hypothetical protein